VGLKSDKNNEESNDSVTTSPSVFLRIRNVSEKNYRKSKHRRYFWDNT